MMCATAKPEQALRIGHASCRIASFRRDRVSEVCQCDGILLAFAASQKCRGGEAAVACPTGAIARARGFRQTTATFVKHQTQASPYSTFPILFTAAISRAESSAMNFENSGASI